MDNKSSILIINELKDIKKVHDGIKYINLKTTDIQVINYFMDKGHSYSYTWSMDLPGYVYVPYETFYNGELIVCDIINNLPSDLSELEKVRYIYITLGKMVGQDINVSLDKNEIVSFVNVGMLDNLWSVMINNKGSNYSVAQLLSYVLHRLGIACKFARHDKCFICEVNIDGNVFSLDLFKDLVFIQSGFETKYFGNDHSLREIDLKIKYISSNYNDIIIRDYCSLNKFKNLFDMLIYLQDVIDIGNMGTIELYAMLLSVISEYYSGEVIINNLYHNTIYGKKEHFVLVSDNLKCYSYNYKSNNFMIVKGKEIINNINDNKIGIYLNESLPNISEKEC